MGEQGAGEGAARDGAGEGAAHDGAGEGEAKDHAAAEFKARLDQWKDMSALLTEAIGLMFTKAESFGAK